MDISKREPSSPLDEALVRATMATYGFAPTDTQVELIKRYIDLLRFWNRKINLTSLSSERDILERHFGESIFALPFLCMVTGRLADVGSGAGFPGLALKIACPELAVVLIEANHKKAAFLSEVRRSLGLKGVEICCNRLEQFEVRGKFADLVCARAVGNLPRLLLWSSKALASHGKLLLWLGRDKATRLAEIADWAWGGPVSIPGSRRRVLLIGECTPTG